MKEPIQLDPHAGDARVWLDFACVNYLGSQALFEHPNIALVFCAATLGHLALEMCLKTALICHGLTVFDPSKVNQLDPSIQLAGADCVWGHGLIVLAERLENLTQGFSLSDALDVPEYIGFSETPPTTIRAGLQIFDPFFTELRYPSELEQVSGIGPDERFLLKALVSGIVRTLNSPCSEALFWERLDELAAMPNILPK